MADRFYLNSPLRPGLVVLQGPEAHHLARVSRVRAGDRVCLFNGDGHEYPAEVVAIDRRTVELNVLSVESPRRELDFRVEVAAPLPKGDRAQFLIEKLTELGVTAFIPLETRRSVVHPGEARIEKLERYVIEASKQCGRNVLMRIAPPAEWSEFCRRSDLPTNKMLGHPGGESPAIGAKQDTVIAVGPEGGLADEEVEAARTAGWRLVDLGPRVLRVETAAVVLATMSVTAPAIAPPPP